MRHIGVLSALAADNPENQTRLAAFLQGLQESGLDRRPQRADRLPLGRGLMPSAFDAVFANFARERPDALFVGGDGFFTSRRVQMSLQAMRHPVAATYGSRDFAEVGGLMSYGTNIPDAIIRSASIPVASSRARSLPTCRYRRRPNTKWCST